MAIAGKLEILYYTRYFKQTLKEAIGFAPAFAEDLCVITTDHARFGEADAVLFHLPNMGMDSIPPQKPTGQIWIGMSMESDANYPLQSDPQFMRHFDVTINFHPNCHVPLLYFDPLLLPDLIKLPGQKRQKGNAVFFASTDFALNNRRAMAAELMQHMSVDSYGKLLNNCRLDGPDLGRDSKLAVIGDYDYYLAFENSNCIDYVSEKVFDGFIAGAVPVYMGAPNVDDYLPADNCIINTRDFDNGKQLAEYLLALSADRNRYEQYHTWRKKPLRQGFLDIVNAQAEPPLRRLCHKLLQMKTVPLDQLSQPDGISVFVRRLKKLTKRILSG